MVFSNSKTTIRVITPIAVSHCLFASGVSWEARGGFFWEEDCTMGRK
jgi:hypothetical protein